MNYSFPAGATLLLTMLLTFGCGSEEASPPEAATRSAATESETGSTVSRAEASIETARPETNDAPIVTLKTNLGDVEIKLDRKTAPITVDNFLEYVHRGHYDGTVFHQVVKGYIVLGGGFSAEFSEKEARTPIRNEAHQSRKNLRGTVAMARQFDTIDSATCQFFINLNDNGMLDHKGRDVEDYGYCVFGEVVKGWEIVEQIAEVEVEDTDDFELKPVRTVVIESARLVR